MKGNPQMPVVHRTLANGSQVGYCRDGDGFRFLSRGDTVSQWTVKGPVYKSWVDIANLIDQGILAP